MMFEGSDSNEHENIDNPIDYSMIDEQLMI